MIQDKNNLSHYIADDGKTFVRLADGFDMGEEMYLGSKDSIDNYIETLIQ